MSLSGISPSSLFSVINSLQGQQSTSKTSTVQQEFQQVGQDLQTGNLTQAQSDFTLLSQNFTNSTQSNSTLSQAFSALGQALQSGNLTSAQKAYTTIQQDVQQLASKGVHHHHHHTQNTQSADTSSSNPLAQAFGSLGQALQSGNLTAA